MAAERNQRKILRGVVVSDLMEKTISVNVERVYRHPKYGKYVRRHKKYHAHDEKGDAHTGDVVEIMECRPLSKLKRFRLMRVVVRAVYPAPGGVA